jgi:hypothetical protein
MSHTFHRFGIAAEDLLGAHIFSIAGAARFAFEKAV